MKDFNGKLAVVTGGASGVGFAIGEALAKQGAKVVLTDIEKESLESSTSMLASQSLDVT
ncbi:SDR family NAD(P)-dependent oxidoreductase, partial [Gammaproteobacteria bacterium]|nr:SDR family NAD(P)-dependent oxidoreductase [Gammaproteobacteria bacterium]